MAPATSYTQGRIRLNEEGARETWVALLAHINFLLDARDTVLGVPDATRKLNKRVSSARRVVAELERTADEHGWDLENNDGEPQRADA